MVIRKWLVILSVMLSPIAYAKEPSLNCIFLGSTPSLIVKFKNIESDKSPNLPPSLLNRLRQPLATFTFAKPMSDGAYILFFTPSQSMQSKQVRRGCYPFSLINELIDDLKTRVKVEYSDPNILMSVAEVRQKVIVPPVISAKQWNLLTLPEAPGGIDAQTAFNTTMGNSHVITAVLDTGILNNISLNPNVLAGVTFNNNGQFSEGAAPSCDSTCRGYNHGTHVGGTIAASGVFAYTENIYGVAPLSKILPVNVFTKYTDAGHCGLETPPCLRSQVADQVNALRWLVGAGFPGLHKAPYVVAVNMSLGGEGTCAASMQKVMDQLFSMNIVFAIAAGNENMDAAGFTPANCTGVMAVAATDHSGYGASYSNYGEIISFAAPGGAGDHPPDSNDIYSTVANAYAYSAGTSMASPHVAGLAALLYSLNPTLTPIEVQTLIYRTATYFPTGGPAYSCTPSKPCGAGIINAAQAVAAVSIPTITWTPSIVVTRNTAAQVTLTWQPASWDPVNLTEIKYIVNNNGADVSNCNGILQTTCVINGLAPSTTYTVYLKATDIRGIYGPAISTSTSFFTSITPAQLTVAVRNPLNLTQAFIYYSSFGNFQADFYSANGVPSNVSVTIDTIRKRFVVSGITTPKKIENVTMTSHFSGSLMTSNAVTIPSIL